MLEHYANIRPIASGGLTMFFTFPEDARWNPDRMAVEFGVEIGEYRGVVRIWRRVFQLLLSEPPTPERCLEAYHLLRTRFELIAERKLRRRQLTDDGNVEITGRDLRERVPRPTVRPSAQVRFARSEPVNGRPARPKPGSPCGSGSAFRREGSAAGSTR
jgi:hypothetical protein